jgi:hypothetical protein
MVIPAEMEKGWSLMWRAGSPTIFDTYLRPVTKKAAENHVSWVQQMSKKASKTARIDAQCPRN